MMKSTRVENLDTLRALAILMVLVFHATQVFGASIPTVWQFAKAGTFGVDLFFALSGYLIGSLFFNEVKANGNVQIVRFILRRISRTVPPYYLALLLSYLAVYIVRDEPFDYGYLLFMQNYYQQMPFFLISWSLCVEEHFYLLLPFILTLLVVVFKRSQVVNIILLLLFSLVPLMLRIKFQDISAAPFGFYLTATHLHFDPLLLGVLFSYVSAYCRRYIDHLANYSAVIYGFCICMLVSYSYWPKPFMYSIGSYLLGLGFAAAVAVAVVNPPWRVSKFKLLHTIAASSYAIYLTHALTLHVVEWLFDIVGYQNILVELSSMLLIACLVGYSFYVVVEKPLMSWRRKAIPSYRKLTSTKSHAPFIR